MTAEKKGKIIHRAKCTAGKVRRKLKALEGTSLRDPLMYEAYQSIEALLGIVEEGENA